VDTLTAYGRLLRVQEAGFTISKSVGSAVRLYTQSNLEPPISGAAIENSQISGAGPSSFFASTLPDTVESLVVVNN